MTGAGWDKFEYMGRPPDPAFRYSTLIVWMRHEHKMKRTEDVKGPAFFRREMRRRRHGHVQGRSQGRRSCDGLRRTTSRSAARARCVPDEIFQDNSRLASGKPCGMGGQSVKPRNSRAAVGVASSGTPRGLSMATALWRATSLTAFHRQRLLPPPSPQLITAAVISCGA
jgi:hypothetical protein